MTIVVKLYDLLGECSNINHVVMCNTNQNQL